MTATLITLPEALTTQQTRQVGDKVFDMPSQSIQTITGVFTENVYGQVMTFYEVTGEKDPTGDGAFPNGMRNDYEICDEDKTLPLDY